MIRTCAISVMRTCAKPYSVELRRHKLQVTSVVLRMWLCAAGQHVACRGVMAHGATWRRRGLTRSRPSDLRRRLAHRHDRAHRLELGSAARADEPQDERAHEPTLPRRGCLIGTRHRADVT